MSAAVLEEPKSVAFWEFHSLNYVQFKNVGLEPVSR